MDIHELKHKLSKFRDDRDWAQFHSPKNLAMALSVEAGELLEQFLWLKDDETAKLLEDSRKKSNIEQEIADVFMYTLLLAESMGIDVIDAARKKIAINEARYPADRVRGSAKKYNEYSSPSSP